MAESEESRVVISNDNEMPQIELFNRLGEIPICQQLFQFASISYEILKESNPTCNSILKNVEQSVQKAYKENAPLWKAQIDAADQMLCSGLEQIQSTSQQICSNVQNEMLKATQRMEEHMEAQRQQNLTMVNEIETSPGSSNQLATMSVHNHSLEQVLDIFFPVNDMETLIDYSPIQQINDPVLRTMLQVGTFSNIVARRIYKYICLRTENVTADDVKEFLKHLYGMIDMISKIYMMHKLKNAIMH